MLVRKADPWTLLPSVWMRINLPFDKLSGIHVHITVWGCISLPPLKAGHKDTAVNHTDRSCLPTGSTLVERGGTVRKGLQKCYLRCSPWRWISEIYIYFTRLHKSLEFKGPALLVRLREESEKETPATFLLCSLSQSLGPERWTAWNLSNRLANWQSEEEKLNLAPLCAVL